MKKRIPNANCKGRKPGSRNKLPPSAVRAEIFSEYGHDYIRVLGQFARSRFKSDKKFFLSHMRRLLPKELQHTGEGGKPLKIVVMAGGEDGDEA